MNIKVGVWNPFTNRCTIESIPVTPGPEQVKELYRLIDCEVIDAFALSENLTVYFDEQFLLKQEKILAENGSLPITRLVTSSGSIELWGILLFMVKDSIDQDIDITWDHLNRIFDTMKTSYRTELQVDTRFKLFKVYEDLWDLPLDTYEKLILVCIASQFPRGLTIDELQRLTSLPRETLGQYLPSLEKNGHVLKTPDVEGFKYSWKNLSK